MIKKFYNHFYFSCYAFPATHIIPLLSRFYPYSILRLVCLGDNVDDGGVDVDVLLRVESDNRFPLRKERRLFNLLSLL